MKFLKDVYVYFTQKNERKLVYSYQGIARYMPLVVAGGFFLATIFLYAFGPLDWHLRNPEKLYPFLLCCVAALIIGYVLATRKAKTPTEHVGVHEDRYLILAAVVALILYIPTVYVSTGKWYPDIYRGIFRTGEAYRVAKYYSQYAPKLLFYVRMLVSPLISIVLPVTLFYFSKLSIIGRILGLLVIALNVCLSISQGVSKQVADTAMQTVLTLCILMFTDNTRKTGWKHKIKIGVIILLVCALFFAYYSNAMKNRVAADIAIGEMDAALMDSDSEEELDQMTGILGNIKVDEEKLEETVENYATFSVADKKENSLWQILIPQKLQPMVEYLTSYFCHGYTGLSLAMEEDFTSSYGLGFSNFFRHNILRFFGGQEAEDAVYQRTYMAKIEKQGWTVGVVWPSFFVYPASDISFPGTVLLVFLIGYLFALSWKDSVSGGNLFALVTFVNLVTMIFYFSANNQMFQNGEQALNFVGNMALWLLTRTVALRKQKTV